MFETISIKVQLNGGVILSESQSGSFSQFVPLQLVSEKNDVTVYLDDHKLKYKSSIVGFFGTKRYSHVAQTVRLDLSAPAPK